MFNSTFPGQAAAINWVAPTDQAAGDWGCILPLEKRAVLSPGKWESGMSYRIFFRAQAAIVGRDDFEAESDQTASIIAEALCDACSDSCDSFELWQGTRAVSARHASLVQVDGGRLTAQMQEVVVRHEELLRDSQ
jgi:hypothetical protein